MMIYMFRSQTGDRLDLLSNQYYGSPVFTGGLLMLITYMMGSWG